MRMSRRMVIGASGSMGPILVGSNSINVDSGTYRYTSENTTNTWRAANYYSDCNYFGQKTGSYNSALIPVGSFNFSGSSAKLCLTMYCYRPSTDFNNFCWAVCNSDSNKTAYQGKYGLFSESTQIVNGVAALTQSGWATYTFEFVSSNFPGNKPLYVYLWPYASGTGVAHFDGTVTASMYY